MEVRYPQRAIAWAPATVANVNIGFDLLGLALESPKERMVINRLTSPQVVKIKLPSSSSLPRDPLLNVAGRSALSVLQKIDAAFGVELEVEKSILPGSGIGSSAASAVAATIGVATLAGVSLSDQELLECALDGEQVASGARHHDNVAPALNGGMVLSSPSGELITLPTPQWSLVILHPQVEVKTSQARALVPNQIPISTVTQSMGWMGSFVHACYQNEAEKAAFALQDLFVGPARAPLIPKFEECKVIALRNGAISGGISGSGPSSFWVCLDDQIATQVEQALTQVMTEFHIECKTYISRVASRGAYAILQS